MSLKIQCVVHALCVAKLFLSHPQHLLNLLIVHYVVVSSVNGTSLTQVVDPCCHWSGTLTSLCCTTQRDQFLESRDAMVKRSVMVLLMP
jgi:hypothetical protein